MRDVNLRYLRETYDDQGVLSRLDLEYPDDFNFAYDIVDDIAVAEPERPAIIWCNPEGEEHRFTFGDIKYWSDKTANYLAGLGIGKGDCVLVIVRRHYQFWFIATALHKLGAVLVPATFMLKEHDLSYRVESCSAKAIICTDVGDIADVCETVAASGECPSLEHLVLVAGGGGGLALTQDGAGHPSDARYGAVLSGADGLCKLRIDAARAARGWLDFNAGVAGATDALRRVPVSIRDPFIMYFSSGTTGNPKMVLHDGGYALAHTLTAKHWHDVRSDGGVHLTIADTGWGKAVWGKYYGQWIMEACVLAYDYDRFVPADILDLIGRYGVTTLCCPPTMYRMLYNAGLESHDLSSLAHCTTAGEALNPDLFENWQASTGLAITEGFGQTETPLTVVNVVGMTPKPGSMGKPNPLYSVEVHDAEGRRCSPGVTGEIVVAIGYGPVTPDGIMMEYYRNPEKTQEACHDGWYHSGDEAWVDEDGYYWYVGRNDDVIKSSGYRIGPTEVESVLIKHPAVAECAVTGVPDELRGAAVKATVVLAGGYTPSDELTRELQTWVKEGTAPYKYPRVISYVDALPKTVNGKIRRAEIRAADYRVAVTPED
ncbi:MAG: AMP-binding protein [Actinomycetes bacterium]|jgi:acetyl-CoA synthetase|nr:AMP-binding protein [Actinomycetes bacterium]